MQNRRSQIFSSKITYRQMEKFMVNPIQYNQ